jgi:hypothetical protein
MPWLASSGMEAEMKPNTGTNVLFDLETEGLNPQRHPIIQLAALAVGQDLEPLEAIELKIRFAESKANKSGLEKQLPTKSEALDPREAARLLATFFKAHAQTAALTQRGKELSRLSSRRIMRRSMDRFLKRGTKGSAAFFLPATNALGDVTATLLLYRALANAERSSCDHPF